MLVSGLMVFYQAQLDETLAIATYGLDETLAIATYGKVKVDMQFNCPRHSYFV